MDPVDQFFDFVERGEHALVNLNPLFALMPTYMHFMPLFVHTVYRRYDFYTHVSLRMMNSAAGVPVEQIR